MTGGRRLGMVKVVPRLAHDGKASHHTLRLSSLVFNGALPVMWHTELIAKVTW